MSEPLIQVDRVSFAYDRHADGRADVLRDVSLTIQPGEFTAIIGNNGSGKSTLMKLILGLLKPRTGQVVVDGIDTRAAKVSALAQHVGFIFQNPNDQLFADSVAAEIAFGPRNLGLPPAEVEVRVAEVLTQFHLTALRDVFPRFLSRGDKQKVCIASIVAMRPSILLLDEPTTGQDHRDARQILDLAADLNRQGICILLVTHDLINVAAYARRTIVMNDGELVRDAPTLTVMTDLPLLARCHLVTPQIVRLSLALADFGLPVALTPAEFLTAIRQRQAKLEARA